MIALTAEDFMLSMGATFESLKNHEIQIDLTTKEYKKAADKEKLCKDGLVEAKERVKSYKGLHVVGIKDYQALLKDVDTIEKYLEQSQALRIQLQANLQALNESKIKLVKNYEELGTKLARAENNLLVIKNDKSKADT